MLHLDLRDSLSLEAAIQGIRPDLIIHTAAYSRVAFCEDHPAAAYEMNTHVTEQIVKICSRRSTRMLFLSSDMVFDGVKGSYCEADAPCPLNYYGKSKLSAEGKVLTLGRNGVVARIALTYGQSAKLGNSFSEEIIRTVRDGRAYSLFTDQLRSFISVSNLTQALWEIAGGDFSGVIHLGGYEPGDRFTFGIKLTQRLGLNQKLLKTALAKETPRPQLHPLNNTFNVQHATDILKTRLLGIEEGLALEYPLR
jgi:dTDP-4-dehydrorhamnose reductase